MAKTGLAISLNTKTIIFAYMRLNVVTSLALFLPHKIVQYIPFFVSEDATLCFQWGSPLEAWDILGSQKRKGCGRGQLIQPLGELWSQMAAPKPERSFIPNASPERHSLILAPVTDKVRVAALAPTLSVSYLLYVSGVSVWAQGKQWRPAATLCPGLAVAVRNCCFSLTPSIQSGCVYVCAHGHMRGFDYSFLGQ